MSNSDWTLTNPIDHSLNATWPDEVRNLKDLLKSRLIASDTEPSARTDSTAFTSTDHGSIWFDTNSSPDNIMYVLTAFGGPTWTPISTEVIATLLASARIFTAVVSLSLADPTLTVINTDSEDTEGGRQGRFIFKGTQSGDEETTLGYIEFAHSGVADDQKGRCRIVLNDGDDGDTPSKIAIDFDGDGSIDVANSLCVLDEDDLTTDSATHLATQQSIKKYIDALIATKTGVLSAYTLNDSDSNAMKKTHAYLAVTDGIVCARGTYTDNDVLNGYVDTDNNPASGGLLVASNGQSGATGKLFSVTFPVAEGEYFEITVTGTGTADPDIYWKSFGTLSAPVDQD